MKNGYIIGGNKLSDQQFSDKYWLYGDAEYQFHSMDISDGLDERQQLLINNDRALYERIKIINQQYWNSVEEKKLAYKWFKKAITALAIINAVIVGTIIMILRSLNNQ